MAVLQVITSCNSTQVDLVKEFCQSTQHSLAAALSNHVEKGLGAGQGMKDSVAHLFEYVDHVQTYPRFKFAGVEGTKVCTVAFRKLPWGYAR